MPFLSLSLAKDPDAPAVDDGIRILSYRDLAMEAEGTARRLGALGVGCGDVVALNGDPDAAWLAAFHGSLMVGAAVAPIHTRWTTEEAGWALGLLRPKVVLVGRGSEPPPGGPAFSLSLEGRSSLPQLGDVEAVGGSLSGVTRDSVAAHLLTSGTTGASRPVAVTVGNLLASAEGARERLGLRPSDRWLGILSPAHVGGLALITRASVVGSALVLRGSFEVDTFVSLLQAGAFSHASVVPTMLYQVLREWGETKVPDSLRCLLVGGAPASASLVEESLDRGLPLALTYGLTEATSQVATAPPNLVRRKPGTVGEPLPGVRVRLSAGGEILVRGPTVVPGQAGEDGWLHSGDLARRDADGHLWITGRLSDRIISGGVNVAPEAVEAVLKVHPGVEEAVVVGIPDREWGERVVAAVVRRRGWHTSEEDLNQVVRASLPAPQRPKAFRFLESLPRNPNGKADRERIRALFR